MPATIEAHHRVEVLDASRSEDRAEALALVNDALEAGSLSLDGVFPLLVASDADSRRLVIRDGQRIVAHAAARCVTAHLRGGGELRIVNIGCVATHVSARRRGHAGLLVRALLASASARGADLAVLWAAEPALYRRLGFIEAGVESSFGVSRAQLSDVAAAAIRPVRPDDVATLLALRQADPVRLERTPGDLRRLLAIPRSHAFVVLDDGHAVVGYIVVGKGLDYPGMVGEWAMPAALLPGALRAVLEESGARETIVFGPSHGEWVRLMSRRGHARDDHALAMFSLLDRERLCLRAGVQTHPELDDHDFLRLLVGSPEDARPALVPFYIWGLDSN